MSIKDIISFEIRERIALQKDLLKRAGDSARIEGSIDALQGLLESFIDSLPEQPVEGLEEAAKEYASDYPAWNDDQHIAKYAFIAGAKWMAEHKKI